LGCVWGQTIQGDDQATVLLSSLSQAVPVLTLTFPPAPKLPDFNSPKPFCPACC